MSSEPVVLQLLSSIHLGGQENLLLSLLEEAARSHQGRFVVVVMNTGINPILYDRLLALGIPVYFLNRQEGHKHFKYLFSLLKIIRKHHVRIIHTHDFGTKYWGAACKIVAPHLRLVFTSHNTRPINRNAAINRLLHKQIIDVNIVISQTVQSIFSAHKIRNTYYIPNGIDLQKFKCLPRKIEDDTLRLINVARIVPEVKGQDTLIKALHLCRQNNIPFHCTFVGEILPFHKQNLKKLQQLVTHYDLDQHIHFTGPSSDVPQRLREHDLFILPSRKEAFGLAIIESMAAGVPVITSNVEGPSEIIRHGENGLLFEMDNEIDLFNKIRFAYLHRDTLLKISQQACQDVQSYSIEQTLALHLELYQNLMKGNASIHEA